MKKLTHIRGRISLEEPPKRKDENGYSIMTHEEKLEYFSAYAEWRGRVYISFWVNEHISVEEIKRRAKRTGIIAELDAVWESIESTRVQL